MGDPLGSRPPSQYDRCVKTTHTTAGIGGRKKKRWHPQFTNQCEVTAVLAYLIIDEYLMISKSFLQPLLTNISIGKEGADDHQNILFSGVSVILCGDLHQFPPVMGSPQEPLFKPLDIARDSNTCKSG
jgi:hypothetical protein